MSKGGETVTGVFLTIMITLLCLLVVPRAFAGPPFLTDDPDVVDFHHYELFIPVTMAETSDGYQLQGPGIEVNAGVLLPNLQLHIIATPAENVPQIGADTVGMGDTELGAEYRFIQETKHRPMVATYPMIEVPTGSASRGLGNGQAYYHLPLWAQKSWGEWTSYGGGGYTVNPAPGMRNYVTAGWEIQRNVTKGIWLGGEMFYQGADTFTDHSATYADLGGSIALSHNLNLLFSGGHTFRGDSRAEAYVSLVWNW